MTKYLLVQFYLYKLYIRTILFFKGFHIFEEEDVKDLTVCKTYSFHTMQGHTIEFKLYRSPYICVRYQLGIFKKKTYINYFLRVSFDPDLSEDLKYFNKMTLHSFGFYIQEKHEDIFLQIIVGKYLDYVTKNLNTTI